MSHCSFKKPKVAMRHYLYTVFQLDCHVRSTVAVDHFYMLALSGTLLA